VVGGIKIWKWRNPLLKKAACSLSTHQIARADLNHFIRGGEEKSLLLESKGKGGMGRDKKYVLILEELNKKESTMNE